MNGRLARVFDGVEFPVIAMAHLPALPGTPLHDAATGMAGRGVDAVARDVEILLDEGVDAVMFCNENDRPYRLQATLADAAAMARVVARARAARPALRRRLPVGRRLRARGRRRHRREPSSARSCPASTRATWGCGGPIPRGVLRERRALGADGSRC